jgi:hypothetical protein
MMDFEEKMRTRAYSSQLLYGKPGTPERRAYQEDQQRLHKEYAAEFRAWLLSMGVPEQYVDKVAAVAYDEGHSGGYPEILGHAQTLVEIFT